MNSRKMGTDRLIDLQALLLLVASRSDYVRIARRCLHENEYDDDNAASRNVDDADQQKQYEKKISESSYHHRPDYPGFCRLELDEPLSQCEELRPGSRAAMELHQLLFSQSQDKRIDDDLTHFLNPHAVDKFPNEALRALLSLPASTKVPWNATKALIKRIQNLDTMKNKCYAQSLQTNLSDIQIFLTHCYLQHPKYGRAVLKELDELFHIIIQPNRLPTDDSDQTLADIDRCDTSLHLPLTILPCILDTRIRFQHNFIDAKSDHEATLSMEKFSASFAILLDHLVPEDEQYWIQLPERISPLLLCISKFWHLMGRQSCARLQFVLTRIVQMREPCIIPEQHVCEIIQSLVHITSCEFSEKETYQSSLLKVWADLLLRFFGLSYEYSLSTIYRLESIIAASYLSLASNTMKNLFSYIVDSAGDASDISPSIRVQWLLNILQNELNNSPISIRTIIPDRVVEKSNLVFKAMDRLVLLSHTDGSRWHHHVLSESNITYDGLQSIFRTVGYVGDPTNQCILQNETVGTFFNDASALINATLAFRSPSVQSESNSPQALIGTCTRILDCAHRYSLTYSHVMFMISALVIVYWKYPALRLEIVHQYLVPSISGNQQRQQTVPRLLYLFVIIAILNGLHQESEPQHELLLSPLFELLRINIAQADASFAFELVISLSQSELGRNSIGVMMKDYFKQFSAWTNEVMLKNVLEIMILLLKDDSFGTIKSDLTACPMTIFATIRLRNFIARNDPFLPEQLRCDILRSLTGHVVNMNNWSFERIFHSVLISTLSFFIEIESGTSIEIGNCSFPSHLRFMPYLRDGHSHSDEIISLIYFICVAFRAQQKKGDGKTAHASFMELILFINRPMHFREQTIAHSDTSMLVAYLFLKGIIDSLLHDSADTRSDLQLGSNSSSFQNSIVESEKRCWNINDFSPDLREHWFESPGRLSTLRCFGQSPDHDSMNKILDRIRLVFIAAILEEIPSDDCFDDDAQVTEAYIEIFTSLCILLGHPLNASGHLSSHLSFSCDEDNSFNALSLDTVKRFFQISCTLCRHITSSYTYVSDKAWLAVYLSFGIIIDLANHLKCIKGTTPILLDSIITTVWDIYFIFISHDKASILWDSVYSFLTSKRLNLVAYSGYKHLLSGKESRSDLVSVQKDIKENLVSVLRSLIKEYNMITCEGLPFLVHVVSTLCEDVRTEISDKSEDLGTILFDETVSLLTECIEKAIVNVDELNKRNLRIDLSTLTLLRSTLLISSRSLWESLNNDILFVTFIEKATFVSIYLIPKLIRRIDYSICLLSTVDLSASSNQEKECAEFVPLVMALEKAFYSQLPPIYSHNSLNDSPFIFLEQFSQVYVENSFSFTSKPPRSTFSFFCIAVIDTFLHDAIGLLTDASKSTVLCIPRLVVYSSNSVKILATLMFHLMSMSQFASSEVCPTKVQDSVTKAWRKKIYSCLDHLTLLLLHSIRLVRHQVVSTMQGNLGIELVDDLRLADAVAFLIVWFNPFFDSFVYSIEKNLHDTIGKAGVHEKNDSTVPGVRKVFRHLEDLESERLKILKSLQVASVEQASASSLDLLFAAVSQKISIPFTTLDRLLARNCEMDVMRSAKVDQDRDSSTNKQQRSKKRLRICNPLVKEWRNLDKNLIEKGERGRQDAFEDLNDFIVEG